MMRRVLAPLTFAAAVLVVAGLPGAASAKPKAAVVVVRDAVTSPGGELVIEGQVVADKGFEVTRAGGVTGHFATLRKVWKNLQLIRGKPVKHATVHLTVAGKSYAVKTNRKGEFALNLGQRSGLKPGQYSIDAHLDGGRPYRVLPGRLAVWPASRGRGALVSDLDDTIIKTDATHVIQEVKHTLTTDAGDMKAVPGAARAYRAVSRDGVPTVYVSAGIGTLYPKLRGFLRDNGFPDGPVLLKPAGIKNFFTDIRSYKTNRLAHVERTLPDRSLVLVGDSGQKDPESYHDVRARDPGRTSGVFIHRVTNEKPDSPRFKGDRVFDHYDEGVVRALRAAGRGQSARERVRPARIRGRRGARRVRDPPGPRARPRGPVLIRRPAPRARPAGAAQSSDGLARIRRLRRLVSAVLDLLDADHDPAPGRGHLRQHRHGHLRRHGRLLPHGGAAGAGAAGQHRAPGADAPHDPASGAGLGGRVHRRVAGAVHEARGPAGRRCAVPRRRPGRPHVPHPRGSRAADRGRPGAGARRSVRRDRGDVGPEPPHRHRGVQGQDRADDHRSGARLAALLPGARVRLLPDAAGHRPAPRQPRVVARGPAGGGGEFNRCCCWTRASRSGRRLPRSAPTGGRSRESPGGIWRVAWRWHLGRSRVQARRVCSTARRRLRSWRWCADPCPRDVAAGRPP